MHTLGKKLNGDRIDLRSFLRQVCSDLLVLNRFTNDFLSAHSEWRILAIQASHKYFNDLATMKPNESVARTAQQFGFSTAEVLFANRIALMILFGLSHYLQWGGFDIKEPTSFPEVSNKLLFARDAIVGISFSLVRSSMIAFENRHFSQAEIIASHYEHGFGVGLALGFLISEAHLNDPKSALDLLQTGYPK